MNIKDTLQTANRKFSKAKLRIKDELNLIDDLTILPFRGYGKKNWFTVRGRVLEQEGKLDHYNQERDKLINNLRYMYRRYETDEIPLIRVECNFNRKTYQTSTDDDGYFEFRVTTDYELREGWNEATLRLIDNPYTEQKNVSATARFLVPPANAQFGIISDVDDTIVRSEATEFLTKMKTLLKNNAKTRVPFEGVAAFYKALQRGKSGQALNPLFFISGSQWNIYDLLDRFCHLHDIPRAPFFLRKFGNLMDRKPLKQHKFDRIGEVLECFSGLRFILIGDSGQEDPEIYQEVVERYPGRIEAIYIRDVTPDNRDREVQFIAQPMEDHNVEMKPVENTMQAAKHALEKGYIMEEDLKKIEENTYEDQQINDVF